MPFDRDSSPNLISNNSISVNNEELLTISEKIIKILKNLFIEYVVPNYIIIIGFIASVIFLIYRYNSTKNKKKNYNKLS